MTNTAYAHFIGIGGAGMSGLARVLHDRGFVVTGSDLKASRYATALQEAGVRVSIGHTAENLGDPDVVVISSAIPESNPELAEARRRGLEVWPRARMLAHLAGDDATLAVAGTHGKTTTSSMLATVLDGMGLDPTFLIGGELNDMGANARCGAAGYYVVEADESDGSFLHLRPHVAVITNVEPDHLDHYGSFEAIIETFGRFVAAIDPAGAAVVCADDRGLVDLARASARCRVVTYGAAAEADVRCSDLVREGLGHRFTVTLPDGTAIAARIAVPGTHNVLNATGVLAAIYSLALDVRAAVGPLESFSGVRRRFDHVGDVGGVFVVDDYAHHPTEIKATLAAVRSISQGGRVIVAFQPHRYTRTKGLMEEFTTSFNEADVLIMTDIYAASEEPIEGVSGEALAERIRMSGHKQVLYIPSKKEVMEKIVQMAQPGDMVVTLGAGDIVKVSDSLAALWSEHRQEG